MIDVMLQVRSVNCSRHEQVTTSQLATRDVQLKCRSLQAEDGLDDVIADDLVAKILSEQTTDGKQLTQSEYLVWTVDHPLPSHFLHLLFQVRFTDATNVCSRITPSLSCVYCVLGLSHSAWSEAAKHRR